jgi:DNA-binding MarR family transcriptional regulator
MTTPAAPTLAPVATNATSTVTGDSILHHLSQAYYELITAFERHMGMSRARWAILRRLNDEGNMTQAALSQLLHVDSAAITRQVKQLEAEELVTRWTTPEDNRYTMVALTDKGRAFVKEKRTERDYFERTVTTGLTEGDIEHMRRSLLHMRKNLELLETKE